MKRPMLSAGADLAFDSPVSLFPTLAPLQSVFGARRRENIFRPSAAPRYVI